MPNLRGASPVGRDEGSRSYAARSGSDSGPRRRQRHVVGEPLKRQSDPNAQHRVVKMSGPALRGARPWRGERSRRGSWTAQSKGNRGKSFGD